MYSTSSNFFNVCCLFLAWVHRLWKWLQIFVVVSLIAAGSDSKGPRNEVLHGVRFGYVGCLFRHCCKLHSFCVGVPVALSIHTLLLFLLLLLVDSVVVVVVVVELSCCCSTLDIISKLLILGNS